MQKTIEHFYVEKLFSKELVFNYLMFFWSVRSDCSLWCLSLICLISLWWAVWSWPLVLIWSVWSLYDEQSDLDLLFWSDMSDLFMMSSLILTSCSDLICLISLWWAVWSWPLVLIWSVWSLYDEQSDLDLLFWSDMSDLCLVSCSDLYFVWYLSLICLISCSDLFVIGLICFKCFSLIWSLSLTGLISLSRKPVQKEENLSEEARRVISGLPDLSFMQAKVLMFPSTLTPLLPSSSPSPTPDWHGLLRRAVSPLFLCVSLSSFHETDRNDFNFILLVF